MKKDLSKSEWSLVLFIFAAVFLISACGGGGGGGGNGSGGGLPTVPGNITATTVSHERIDVDWDVSTAGAGIAGYWIMRGALAPIWVGSGTSYSDVGLDPETLYCYSVAAQDNSGNASAFSSQVCATTDPDPSALFTRVRGGSDMDLLSAVWDGSRILAVGDSDELEGQVMTSSDGLDWEVKDGSPAAMYYDMNDILYNGSEYIGVGNSGRTYKSPDGVAWSFSFSVVGFNELQALDWSPDLSLYTAVGEDGVIITSPDGSVWTSVASPTTEWLNDIAWGDSLCVAVGDAGTIVTSPDGAVWSTETTSTSQRIAAVKWNGSQYVAVGWAVILTSTDGSAWSLSNTSVVLEDVVYASSLNLYVAVGAGGTILTSTNGTVWTDRSLGDLWVMFNKVIWTGTRFVAVADFAEVFTSPDGINWTQRSSGYDLYGVIWDGSQYIAVGEKGYVLTSPDGDSWTYYYSGDYEFLRDVATDGSLYAVVEQDVIYTTTDFVTWSPDSTTSGGRAVIYGGGQFVAVNTGLVGGEAYTSPDGSAWARTDTGTQGLRDVVYDGSGQYVAVGTGGTIATSSDAATWTTRDSTIINNILSVSWGDSLYLATATSGNAVTSPDGITWTNRNTGDTSDLRDAAWLGTEFVVVGSGGTILFTTDGTSWSDKSYQYTRYEGAATNGTDIIVVGDQGTIIKSIP